MDLENALVRYEFQEMLKQEFAIHIGEQEHDKLELAKRCIKVYKNIEEFYQKTGWANDNPDEADISYLTENRICRLIDGKLWYFSKICYEEGLSDLKNSRKK